ncbi:MAG: hypothetical protein HYX66_01945 [Ignavibacteria bacterium]|nr:hypothetical protein [Ignavibacteria bacterium]
MLSRHQWVRGFCKGLVTLIVFASSCAGAYPQQTRSSKPFRTSFEVGWVFGIDASQFFRDYQAYLGGGASGFNSPTNVELSIGTFQLSKAPFSLDVGYYRASVRETYEYNPDRAPIPNGPTQSVTQTVLLTVVPTTIGIGYFQMNRQFSTYIDVAAGLAFANMYWEERLSESIKPGARLSGVRYDDWQIAPAVAIKAGVALFFDKRITERARAGINIESGYSFIPMYIPMFQETAKFLAVSPSANKEYYFQMGGLLLRFGLLLVLDPR